MPHFLGNEQEFSQAGVFFITTSWEYKANGKQQCISLGRINLKMKFVLASIHDIMGDKLRLNFGAKSQR